MTVGAIRRHALQSGRPDTKACWQQSNAAVRAATRVSSLPPDAVAHSHPAVTSAPLDATTPSRTLTRNGWQAHTEDRSLQRYAERRVNQGGEQGHDDYGLPPVDIEIPDDA